MSVGTRIVACGCTIYSRMNLIGLPALVSKNNNPTYVSSADTIIFFIMFERVVTAPLYFFVLLKSCDYKNKCSPVQLLAFSSERYDASLCMRSVILML